MSYFERQVSTRRRVAVAGSIGLIVGLAGGWFIGFSSSPSLLDRIEVVRATARDIDGALEPVAREYGQGRSGGTESAVAAKMVKSIQVRLRAARGLSDVNQLAYGNADKALQLLLNDIDHHAPQGKVEADVHAARVALEPLTGRRIT